MALLPLLLLALAASQDAALLRSTFASGADGWTAIQLAGTGGEVTVVHDPERLKVGAGSLRLGYEVGPGKISGAALPLADGAAAKMASIRFWVRPDGDTPLVMTLQEKGGGRYNAMLSAAGGKWQEVALSVRDFVLSAGETDPVDENDRLDPDRIESVAVVDLAGILAQNATLAGVLGIMPGARAVYLSDFRITDAPLPDPVVGAEYVFDPFARPQAGWATLNATASVVSEAPLSARALRLDYNLTSGKAAAAIKPIRLGSLAGKKTLTMRLAAKSACQVVVQLEEKDGGKYNTTVSLPAGGDGSERTVALADLKPADDSKDANGKLDPDQVNQIAVIDITAVIDAPGRNTLWVGKIAAKP